MSIEAGLREKGTREVPRSGIASRVGQDDCDHATAQTGGAVAQTSRGNLKEWADFTAVTQQALTILPIARPG
jgi:hypothetical protein